MRIQSENISILEQSIKSLEEPWISKNQNPIQKLEDSHPLQIPNEIQICSPLSPSPYRNDFPRQPPVQVAQTLQSKDQKSIQAWEHKPEQGYHQIIVGPNTEGSINQDPKIERN